VFHQPGLKGDFTRIKHHRGFHYDFLEVLPFTLTAALKMP
jgi:hypothetical protein